MVLVMNPVMITCPWIISSSTPNKQTNLLHGLLKNNNVGVDVDKKLEYLIFMGFALSPDVLINRWKDIFCLNTAIRGMFRQ